MTEIKQRTTMFDTRYASCLSRIMEAAPKKNKRTDRWVRAVNAMFVHTMGFQFPLIHLRDISPMWSCAEAVWFLSGEKSTGLMKKYGFRTWDKFAGPDGMVDSATGHRWRKAHGTDQLQEIIDKLEADPTSRQAVMVSWLPSVDLVKPGPNAPCIVTWHFHVLNGALHMNVLQRSADMFFGFPHDILGFRIVQEILAARLGWQPGEIGYLISNAHLYEDQWEPATQMIARAYGPGNVEAGDFKLKLGWDTIAHAMQGSEQLPLNLYSQIKDWYQPWPTIQGPRLAK
jgi:thymidylate synthase